jgi:PKD repeat protein
MPGANPPASSVANPSVTYSAVGVYTVSLVASNGFGSSIPATQTISVSACLSIDKNIPNTAYQIYPNPAKNEIFITGVEKGTEIYLYNILGTLVYTGRVESESEKINLTAQNQGLYILRLISEGKMITAKMIKE